MTTKTLVAVKDVWKKFIHEGNEVVILRGIDLTIEEGEMLAVVGPSGAGKSTLLHILGTLDLPTSGRIAFEGKDLTRYSASQLASFRNERLGFVFQFHHLLPEFTALENVMMPGLIRGQSQRSLETRAKELLEEVGLTHRIRHRPGELSGGEQQRVALARALVMEPKLILADEPTGNLDSKTSEAIHKLFIDLNERRGTTFLIVTHSRDLADRMPRTVSMRDGRIETDVRRDRSEVALPGAEPSEPDHEEEHEEEEAQASGEESARSEDASSSGDEAEAKEPAEHVG